MERKEEEELKLTPKHVLTLNLPTLKTQHRFFFL
jgi:hypothetical protein